jgi:hypothetical protein
MTAPSPSSIMTNRYMRDGPGDSSLRRCRHLYPELLPCRRPLNGTRMSSYPPAKRHFILVPSRIDGACRSSLPVVIQRRARGIDVAVGICDSAVSRECDDTRPIRGFGEFDHSYGRVGAVLPTPMLISVWGWIGHLSVFWVVFGGVYREENGCPDCSAVFPRHALT